MALFSTTITALAVLPALIGGGAFMSTRSEVATQRAQLDSVKPQVLQNIFAYRHQLPGIVFTQEQFDNRQPLQATLSVEKFLKGTDFTSASVSLPSVMVQAQVVDRNGTRRSVASTTVADDIQIPVPIPRAARMSHAYMTQRFTGAHRAPILRTRSSSVSRASDNVDLSGIFAFEVFDRASVIESLERNAHGASVDTSAWWGRGVAYEITATLMECDGDQTLRFMKVGGVEMLENAAFSEQLYDAVVSMPMTEQQRATLPTPLQQCVELEPVVQSNSARARKYLLTGILFSAVVALGGMLRQASM